MTLKKCYICLEQCSKLISVDTVDQDNLTVLQKLQIVAPSQEWLGCSAICYGCNDLLQHSYKFIDMCRKYQSERLELIQITNEMFDQNINGFESVSNLNVDSLAYMDMENLENIKEESVEIITIEIEAEPENPEEIVISKDNKAEGILEDFLNDHCQQIESKKCLKCNRSFSNSHELANHIRLEHGYKRKICVKDFRTKGSLGQHVMLEHPKIMSCETCGENFSETRDLVKHCREQHSKKSDEMKPYMCETCEKRFSNWTCLRKHNEYHNITRNFTCKLCGKRFVTKKDVEVHELTHYDEKKFCCNICGKRFKTLSNMLNHIRTVHSDPSKRKFECHFCSKRFVFKSNLEDHIKRHIDLKDYICLVCGASFVSKYDLKRHTYFHTKDRPHKCPFCEDKSYRDMKSLRKHVTKYHSIE